MSRSPAALETLRVARLVEKQPVHAGAQEGAQPSLRGIVGLQKILFEQPGKELLREIAGVFTIGSPAYAQVFVDRPPVGGGDGVHGPITLKRVGALRCQNHRVPGQRERIALSIGGHGALSVASPWSVRGYESGNQNALRTIA